MKSKLEKRYRRKRKVRSRISGSSDRPRISIFRSNKYFYLQLINDEKSETLAHVFGKDPVKTGKKMLELMLKKKIKQAVFDRGGYKYHGNVKKIAETLREGGVKL